jgi:hypothetical protein
MKKSELVSRRFYEIDASKKATFARLIFEKSLADYITIAASQPLFATCCIDINLLLLQSQLQI